MESLMNKNSRIYPYYPAVDDFNNTLSIHHDEKHTHAKINPDFVKTIVNKSQAKSVRRKIGWNFVITGDVFYFKLSWAKYPHEYGFTNFEEPATNKGMAIVRNNEVIWYSIPGTPDGLAERKVLTEKFNKGPIILKGLFSSFDTINR